MHSVFLHFSICRTFFIKAIDYKHVFMYIMLKFYIGVQKSNLNLKAEQVSFIKL